MLNVVVSGGRIFIRPQQLFPQNDDLKTEIRRVDLPFIDSWGFHNILLVHLPFFISDLFCHSGDIDFCCIFIVVFLFGMFWSYFMGFCFWIAHLVCDVVSTWAYWWTFKFLLVQNQNSWSQFFIHSSGWFFGNRRNWAYLYTIRACSIRWSSISLLRFLDQPWMLEQILFLTTYFWWLW